MKSRVVSLRFSEAEIRKISLGKNGKKLSDKVKNLVVEGMKKEQAELQQTAELISKIESADISRIAEGQAEILRGLRRILGECVKTNFALETFTKMQFSTDFYQKWQEDTAKKLEEAGAKK